MFLFEIFGDGATEYVCSQTFPGLSGDDQLSLGDREIYNFILTA